MSGLRVHEVSASYGNRDVLQRVSLSVAPGRILAILGPSGCGKTTLLRAIAGLHRIDEGQILLDDDVVADGSGRSTAIEKRGVGLMPQEGALFPHLDVARNIGFGLPGRRHAHRARVREVADLAGVGDLLSARPQQLSGGQQQRVALARALAPRPRVVLLDEPFAALDAGLRASLRDEVAVMLRSQNAAAVLVTHDQAEALSIADDVAVLLDGSVAQVASPREVYERPRTRRVAEFVGEADFLAATREGRTAVTPIGRLEVIGDGDGDGVVVIRPEQVSVSVDPDGQFVIENCSYTGPHTVVTVRDRHSDILLRARIGVHPVDIGATASISVLRPVAFIRD